MSQAQLHLILGCLRLLPLLLLLRRHALGVRLAVRLLVHAKSLSTRLVSFAALDVARVEALHSSQHVDELRAIRQPVAVAVDLGVGATAV